MATEDPGARLRILPNRFVSPPLGERRIGIRQNLWGEELHGFTPFGACLVMLSGRPSGGAQDVLGWLMKPLIALTLR